MINSSGPYFENKVFFRKESLHQLNDRLSHYCLFPKQYAKGINRSIYFDSDDLSDYQDGLNGNRIRRKVRIRQYQLPGGDWGPSLLEVKKKNGQLVSKKKISIDDIGKIGPDTLERLSKRISDVAVLFSQENICAAEYSPQLIVDYSRERYLIPGTSVRLNVDTAIRCAGRWVAGILPVRSQQLLDACIVELKSTENVGLPFFLTNLHGKRLAFSKYCFLQSIFLEESGLNAQVDSSSDSLRLSGWR